MTVPAIAIIIALFKGRPAADGVIALTAILSPSVLMGVERGNANLLVFAVTGAAALIYNEQRLGRNICAIALTIVAMVLKLFPMFTVALLVRCARVTVCMQLLYRFYPWPI